MKVHLELWLYLNEELAGAFEAPSAMRSAKDLELEEWTSLEAVLRSLGQAHRAVAEKVFDPLAGRLHPQVMVVLNGILILPERLGQTLLKDGDQVRVTPIYVGG